MLTTQNPAMLYAALVAALLGVAALYLAWRRRIARRRAAIALGWLLVAASTVSWIAFAGAEFGPVLALAQLSLVAWLFVLANRHVRPRKGRLQQPERIDLPRFQALARHAARFVLAVPVAAVAGTLLVLAVARFLPWPDVDRIAFALLALPVAWGVAAYWTCADSRLLRPAAGLAAAGAAGALLVFT